MEEDTHNIGVIWLSEAHQFKSGVLFRYMYVLALMAMDCFEMQDDGAITRQISNKFTNLFHTTAIHKGISWAHDQHHKGFRSVQYLYRALTFLFLRRVFLSPNPKILFYC